MNEQSGSMNDCGDRRSDRWSDRWSGHRPHPGMFLPLIVPLGIGFMLGMRKAMMHRMMDQEGGPGKRWENGVPPFFAELHRRAHAADKPETTEA